MDKVYTLEEAMRWFMSHVSGSVICVKDNEEREVNCYPDAVNFLKPKKEGEDDG